MTIAVCQQPNYFSWIGYFEQCARAKHLIILDSVQWIRRGSQNRTKILSHTSQAQANQADGFQWLTIPVLSHGHRTRTLREIQIDPNDHWADRHWATLQHVYGKRPLFKNQFEPLLRPWFEQAHQFQTFSEAAASSMQVCFDCLEIRPQIHFSSKIPLGHPNLVKTDRLISLCQAVNADVYYSGLASASYIDTNAFRESDIRLIWQRWKHTEYTQGCKPFKSHLSILDALANVPIMEIKSWLEIKPWGPFGNINDAIEQPLPSQSPLSRKVIL